MIRFLLKGLIRDKSRSRLPIIVVALGVMLTVFLHAYITGFMGDTIEMNARFTDGHLKVMTKAYAENASQIPNDLAILDATAMMDSLKEQFPDIEWVQRIHFGGLIDVPDENGETRSQGPAMGIGLDLLSPGTQEVERLSLEKSLVRGKRPEKQGEVLLSDEFSLKLKTGPGDTVTLIGSTMFGSMSIHNFVVSGTVSFGNDILDRGAVITDIGDAQLALDMTGAAGEILGFQKEGFYENDEALKIAGQFNEKYAGSTDEYAPVMQTLGQQPSMSFYIQMSDYWAFYITLVFVLAMSLVLWNAGLIGGLRRYGEIGVRLAMGEEKSHVYRTMIVESVMIGIAGTVVGTAFGLFFAFLLQKYGIDISVMMQGASVMMPMVIRAHITPADYYIGFLPGLLSTVLGTLLSGIGIFKRQTAKLFKELEA
ncbi:MAG: FtsX-like permease family protein [Bacteroidales bacterium]|nr:FtsX-like permease family protein [Bacteroidales bacterium]